MFKNKYSNFLTIFLVIIIIVILIVASVVIVKAIQNNQDEKEKKKILATLEDGSQEDNNDENNKTDDENNSTIEDFINGAPIENNTNENAGSGDGSGTTRRKTVFYKEYPVIGYIKIPKTKASYPILLDASPGALDTAVAVTYPTNPTLNTPGNVVIIGHNYRNGKFFANNKKLVVGDTIQITDLVGKTLTYTIYEIMTLKDTDTTYAVRDTGGKIEISLSTCTDDGSGRLVILARVE